MKHFLNPHKNGCSSLPALTKLMDLQTYQCEVPEGSLTIWNKLINSAASVSFAKEVEHISAFKKQKIKLILTFWQS